MCHLHLFKFPDTVPPAVTAFVNSLLPLFLNINSFQDNINFIKILAVSGLTKSGFTGGLAIIKNSDPTTISGKVIIIPLDIDFRADGDRPIYFIHAIRYLCACQKDRSSDLLKNIMMKSFAMGFVPEIPDKICLISQVMYLNS